MSEIYWSSELSTFSASSAVERGKIVVSSVHGGNAKVIFEQEYTLGYEGFIVSGIDKIIESDLLSHDLSYSRYKIKLSGILSTNGQPNTFIDVDGTVIYCPRHMPVSAEDYLEDHFLIPPCCDIPVLRLPIGFSEDLSLFAFLFGTTNVTLCKHAGPFPNDTAGTNQNTALQPGMREISIPGAEDGQPLYITVGCGMRSFAVSMTEERSSHDVLFRFRNLFNLQDYVYINGITDITPSVTSEEVIVNGYRRLADIHRSDEFTITTEGLTLGEAERVSELLSSHYVEIYSNGVWERVIVTDVSGLSNDPSTLNSVKIKYKKSRI